MQINPITSNLNNKLPKRNNFVSLFKGSQKPKEEPKHDFVTILKELIHFQGV